MNFLRLLCPYKKPTDTSKQTKPTNQTNLPKQTNKNSHGNIFYGKKEFQKCTSSFENDFN